MKYSKIVVAFSGGLDTSYLVAWLKNTTDAAIHTITVDTGGFSRPELAEIEKRAKDIGADQHLTIDGRQETFDRVVKTLIQGNVLRGHLYPLCVSAERVTQAEIIARAAVELGADGIAHGSTGAGNDQVRFDVALRTLSPQIAILTPIRDQALSRQDETDWLCQHGVAVEDNSSKYSVNAGMWGITIGGGETHDPWETIPDGAYSTVKNPEDTPLSGAKITIKFQDAFHGTNLMLEFEGGRRIEAKIPRGVKTGSRVRLKGQGIPGSSGGHTGDLYLKVKVLPDSRFQREGDDLRSIVRVDLFTLLLGGQAQVPSIDRTVKLEIPAETSNGKIFRLRGLGMPNMKNPEHRGVLYATVEAQLPQNMTSQEIELLQQWQKIRSG